jgi:hypothetical protein
MVTEEPPLTETEKRQALQAVLTSAAFSRSTQLRSLLQYVCEREISGRSAELTEYQIAVEVLGRRKDFNLSDDSSVRNRFFELRQRLEKYYSVENAGAQLHICIPRGSYVPYYTRNQPSTAVVASPFTMDVAKPVHPILEAPFPAAPRRAPRYSVLITVATVCLAAGAAGGWYFSRPAPPSVIKEAWGPLADAGDELLISVATSLHMIVRPHIAEHHWRFAAPPELREVYGPNRPLESGTPLYMEPAQLSVPLAELTAVAIVSNVRTAFGGGYQVLPESEAPVAALRGRNAILIGTGTNSEAARTLLRNLPFTIDYNSSDRFCVLDQRKPAGQNELFPSQPVGQPVPSTTYGLLSVLTWPESGGKVKRTVVLSGAASAGVQAAAEFFCSPTRMRELKERLHGLPPAYQVVVRCKTSGVRLISYEYITHEIGYVR